MQKLNEFINAAHNFRNCAIVDDEFPALRDRFDALLTRMTDWNKDRPEVVCLCGSTRFKSSYESLAAELALVGKIHLTVGMFGHADGILLSEETKASLDLLHKQKIDMCDRVIVINVDGYIGESTKSEIEYARSIGVPVEFLCDESETPPEVPKGIPLTPYSQRVCVPHQLAEPTVYSYPTRVFELIENSKGLLVDEEIRHLAEVHKMIEPYAEGIDRPGVISYGQTSTGYDVRIGRKFKIFTNVRGAVSDPKKVNPDAFIEVTVEKDGDYISIPPNSYALGESVEYFRLPRDITTICIGKSTYARCGIIVNVTPGEPEWEGRWTIEISNSTPVPAHVYAGEGIMQVLFIRAAGKVKKSYKDKKGKYQGDTGLQTAVVK